MRRLLLVIASIAITVLPASIAAPAAEAGSTAITIAGPRPALVVLPSVRKPARPRPLVVLLHGYTGSGAVMDAYLHWRAQAATSDVVLAFPDGTRQGGDGPRFWNATDACCDFLGSGVDDVGYITALVDSITARTPIDRHRVYLVGHSNGAFMAYRLACQRADMFAAVIGIAGATYAKAAACSPSRPVSILAVHGTADLTVSMDGGTLLAPYPSTARTLAMWAGYDRCAVASGLRRIGTIDIERLLPGVETSVLRYRCPAGIDVELWRITGGQHSPSPNADFGRRALAWLLRHHR